MSKSMSKLNQITMSKLSIEEQIKALMAIADQKENIKEEVAVLMEAAIAKIDSKVLAREYVNRHLMSMPMVIEGSVKVKYTDDLNKAQEKEQSKNTTLWLIALYETIENGYTKDQFIGKSFYDFMNAQGYMDTTFESQERQSCIELAGRFSKAMISLNIINRMANDIDYIDDKGIVRKVKVWSLTEDFKSQLETIKEELVAKTHYLCKPLKNKPMKWTSMSNGVSVNANLRLVPSYLSNSDYVDTRVLSAVNRLQEVPFKAHKELIRLIPSLIQSLVKPELEKCVSEKVYQSEIGKYENTLRMLEEASKLPEAEIYFAITLDQRGRMYYRGGDLTPQGNDFCKALFQFKNEVALGSKGLKAICITLANAIGLDKKSVTKKLSIINTMYKKGSFKAFQPNCDLSIIETLKGEQWQSFVAILELNRVMDLINAGHKKETIMSSLVCHQDGTCNGLQHIAAIMRDRRTAETVNLTGSTEDDIPKDIYGLVVENAIKHSLPEHKEVIEALGRELGKKPVMVGSYGASTKSQEIEVLRTISDYELETKKAVYQPELLAKAIIQGIQDSLPAIDKFTNTMKALIKTFLADGGERLEWKTLDGFKVITEYADIENKLIRTIDSGLSAMVNSNIEGNKIAKVIDLIKTAGAFSPNFIHTMDALMVRLVVRMLDMDLVAIHDSIGSHAGNYFEVKQAIRECFIAIHNTKSQIQSLTDFMSKQTNKDYIVEDFKGTFDLSEIMKSEYIFK